MIFFGSRATTLQNGRINNVTCPSCENTTSFTYTVFGKYAHVWWIPFFPTGKAAYLECDHCKRTFEEKELPAQIQQKFAPERKEVKTPIWNFAGLGLIAAFVAWGAYASKQQKANEAEYLKAPQVGDVYSTKGDREGYYTSYKVLRVTNDSVYGVFNDYEIDQKHSIDEIDIDENYGSVESDPLSREELVQFYNEGIIYEIDRD